MKQENELGLRISAKYNRIYVHRTTLKAIGNPEFVSLGIHPKSKKLVVLAAEECDKEAMRVRYTEDNMFCIYSKGAVGRHLYGGTTDWSTGLLPAAWKADEGTECSLL